MDNKKEVDFKKLTEEYIKIQLNRAKVGVASFYNLVKDNASKSKDDFENYVKTHAREYGQDIDKMSEYYEAKAKYDDAVKEIKNTYGAVFKDLQIEKGKLELKELQVASKLFYYRNKENIKQTNEFDKIEEKVKRDIYDKENDEEKSEKNEGKQEDSIKDLLKERREILRAKRECDSRMDKVKQDIEQELKIVEILKDKEFHNVNQGYLVEVKKKNILTKALGWIRNKIDGKKRFSDEIIKTLNNGLNNFKQKKLPEIQAKLQKEEKIFVDYLESKVNLKDIDKEENKDDKNNENGKSKGVKETISDKIDTAGNYVSEKYKGTKETVSGAIDTAGNYVSEKYKGAKETVPGAIDTAGNYVSKKYKGAKETVSSAIDTAGNYVSDKYKGTKETVSSAIDTAGNYVSEKYKGAKETVSGAIDTAGNYVSDKYEGAKSTANLTYNSILEFYNNKKEYVINEMVKTIEKEGKEVPTKEHRNEKRQKDDNLEIE